MNLSLRVCDLRVLFEKILLRSLEYPHTFLPWFQSYVLHKHLMPLWLTWHFVEQPFSAPSLSLQVFTIQRPVNVCDETERLVAFLNFLMPPLATAWSVYWAIIGSHCGHLEKISFHLNDFFSIFDMNLLSIISERIKKQSDK